MNILLINHYAGSPKHGMEYRPYYLAREWVNAGHQVTIAAASYSHLRVQAPHVHGPMTQESIDGVRYCWLKTPRYEGNGIRRSLNMGAFVMQLLRHRSGLICDRRPDLVIASSTYPLDIYPAHRIARRAGAKLVFEVHDLWPLTPMELGKMSAWHPFIFTLQRAEDFACRHSDRIISMLPKADAHLQQRGMAAHKFAYIPNGIHHSEWEADALPLPSEHAAAIDRLRSQGHFIVAYAGAHGVANALCTVIEAAARLRQEPVTFVLVGQGPEKDLLESQARAAGLTNLIFLPAVPKRAVFSLLKAMDALYIGLARQPLFRFGVSPNKLFDYMMAAKPIVQAIDAGNDLVAESECGISCPAEDPAALAEAVLRLHSMPAAQREAMGRRGKDFVMRHHDYRILARRFLDAVQ
jgi:glycosyltransferase involved in cell wall biosynthesis